MYVSNPDPSFLSVAVSSMTQYDREPVAEHQKQAVGLVLTGVACPWEVDDDEVLAWGWLDDEWFEGEGEGAASWRKEEGW